MRLFEMCDGPQMPVIAELNQILSDTFALYFKTHAYHWNVEGMFFEPLHTLFQEQYEEMWESVDEIAERVRQIGGKPASAMQNMMPTVITNGREGICARDMVIDLRNSHALLIQRLSDAIKLSQQMGDEGTADVFIQRIKAHQKHMWKLDASSRQILDHAAHTDTTVVIAITEDED